MTTGIKRLFNQHNGIVSDGDSALTPLPRCGPVPECFNSMQHRFLITSAPALGAPDPPLSEGLVIPPRSTRVSPPGGGVAPAAPPAAGTGPRDREPELRTPTTPGFCACFSPGPN